MPTFIQPEYKIFYDQIAAIIGNKKVTASNIIYLAGSAMQIVENAKEMTGPEKKELVLNILKEVVRKQRSIVEDEKQILYMMIDQLVPGAVDLVVAGANGELGINEAEIRSCLPCLKIKKTPPPEHDPENVNNTARVLFKANAKKDKSKSRKHKKH